MNNVGWGHREAIPELTATALWEVMNNNLQPALLAAKVFTETARKLGSGLTRASLINALNSMRNYHTGFTPDLTMTPDHGPNKQILYMKWDGTQFNQATPFGPW